jgi:hypothetical protein
MPDCGLNLPCTQQVNTERTPSLWILNTGTAIKGQNYQSTDPAVVGDSSDVVGEQGIGVQGRTPYGIGVSGVSISSASPASSNIGVWGTSGSEPIFPDGDPKPIGVLGTYGSAPWFLNALPVGVLGSCGGGEDRTGQRGAGVMGISSIANGVVGITDTDFASGVIGGATNNNDTGNWRWGVAGVGAQVSKGGGVLGSGNGVGFGGYFMGPVHTEGNTSHASSGFQIDHPLEPDAKYLNHSAVESPDMKNVYDGVVTLDYQGSAWVELAAWFEALNRDFRYQLTPIGSYAPVYVAQEIADNRFQVAGGKPGQRISWLVSGIRRDLWAEKNPIVVEEDKDRADHGKFLYPLEAGHPKEMGISYSRVGALETFRQGQKTTPAATQSRTRG